MEKIALAPYRLLRTRQSKKSDGSWLIQSKAGKFVFNELTGRFLSALRDRSQLGLECQRICEDYDVLDDEIYHDLLMFSFQLSEAGLLKWEAPQQKLGKVVGRGKGIYIIDNFLTPEEVSQLKKRVEDESSWRPAGVVSRQGVGRVRKEIRDAKALTLKNELAFQSLNRRLTVRLRRAIIDVYQISRLKSEPFQMIHYSNGGFYKPHRDCLNKDNLTRIISSVIFLNDDFAEGQLRFNSLDLDVRPKRGRLVLFPSIYLHEARKAKKGTKTILVTWSRFQ